MGVPGVLAAGVNRVTHTAQVRRLAGSADDTTLAAAVQRAGYSAVALASDAPPPAARNNDPGWKV